MMFFRSIASVFSGVSAFPEMAKRNPFRAVFHLLLFCILVSCLCAGIRTWKIGKGIDTAAAGLEAHFGQVTVSSAGYIPEKNAEKARTFYLPGGFRLDYLKQENLPIVREIRNWKHQQGVFWLQNGFVMWVRPNPVLDAFYLAPIPFPMKQSYQLSPVKLQTLHPFNAAGIENFLKPYFQPVKDQGISAKRFSFPEEGNRLKHLLYAMLVITESLKHFFLTMLMILMFGAMQGFWRAPGLEKLGFGGTVALLSYASYPAVSAGILLENLSFPTGSEILFFVLFFIGQLLAFNEVRRSQSGNADS